MGITRQKLQDGPVLWGTGGGGVRLARFSLLVHALVSMLLVLILPATRSQAQTGAMVGVLAAGADSVFVNRLQVAPGKAIFEGDIVQTDASGRARLDLLDHSTLHLAGNSDVRVARVVNATAERPSTIVLDLQQGVARLITGTPERPEIALVRGGGAIASIRGGTLDMVASNERLVTAMRSGVSSCRGAKGDVLTATRSRRVCILARGTIRPSGLSMAMKRVIDERLSVPPSALTQGVGSFVFTQARASDGTVPDQRQDFQTSSAFAPVGPSQPETPQSFFERLNPSKPSPERQQIPPASLTVEPIPLSSQANGLRESSMMFGQVRRVDTLPLFTEAEGDFLDNSTQAPQNGND